jgi:RNA polymerase sigma-70 factor (ECF subfamily)
MLYADARAAARRDSAGAYVPLDAQDPARWNAAAIAEAETLLQRAAACRQIGRFQIEAAIQSVHAERRLGRATNYVAILALYDALFRLTASPVVALNRAVAVGHVRGPVAGLAAVDAIAADAGVRAYQPYWAVRADLLARAGDRAAADAAYTQAIGLTVDPAVRRYLTARRAATMR